MSIGHHCFCHLCSAYQNYHFLRSCHGGIEKVFGQKHSRCAIEGQNDDGVFTALTFMHGYGVCMLQLLERRELVCDVLIIEDDLHTFIEVVDPQNSAYVTVEDSHSGSVILATPLYFVVVLYLHDLVALAEDPFAVLMLSFFR